MYKKKMIFGVVALLALTGSLDVYASGQALNESAADVDNFARDLFCQVRDVIVGPLGTTVGIIVSLTGLYQYLLKKSLYGFYFFIAGVALTGLPGIFHWYSQGVSEGLGGTYSHSKDSLCGAPGAVPSEGEKGPLSLTKDRDVRAEMGEGLLSIIEGDIGSRCISYVDKSGAASGSLCVK